ncbi:MAG TPA: ATP-binding protein [Sulfuricella sp.]|nr:ATP-binding protein [Sulfuricella sp.]
MSLRAKLLLPLLLIGMLMGGFLYYEWIPNSLAIEEATHLKAVNQHLDSVVEGLIPLLLGNQLDIIHENLNALKRKNTTWIDIRLADGDGKQLYPLATFPPPPEVWHRPDVRTLKKTIVYLNMNLGSLVVQVDLSPTLADARRESRKLTIMLFGMLALLTTTIVLMVEFTVSRPIHHLAEASRRIAQRDFDSALPKPGNDEVGALVENFATMRDSLRDYHTNLLHEIAERKEAEEALTKLNATLEQRVGEELAKNREKDHLLIQQSRLAAMGEMVHNIAHQWRQPLNSLSLIVSNINDDFRFNTMTPETLNRDVSSVRRLIEKMSSTIDDFREFFRPDREESQFDLAEAIRDAISIIEATFKNNNIGLELEMPPHAIMVTGFHNQYAQVVLNLLANAKESIMESKVGKGRVRILLQEQDGAAVLSVEDNGGGITEEVLPKLFEPYFTTKEQGSGVGLYMVKMIIERNMHGTVSAMNLEHGAKFTLSVPLYSTR